MTRSFRTASCPDCSGEGRYAVPDAHGFHDEFCEMCDRTGEIDCQCAECGNVVPLDDEGLCERCHDASTLPLVEFDLKYLGEPVAERVKRRAA